jgi:hypothetical protein
MRRANFIFLRGSPVFTRAVGLAALSLTLAACMAAPAASPTLPPTPSPAPTEAPTATPTEAPTPTEEPSPTPTEAPTVAPTEEPTASPAEEPSPSPTDGASAEQLFLDDMTDPESGWGVAEGERGSVGYADGALRLQTIFAGAYVWSTRPLQSRWNAVRAEALLVAEQGETGYTGLLCGNAESVVVGGLVTTDGGWVFVRIEDDAVEVLEFDLEAGVELGDDFIQLTLDCVTTGFGEAELYLHVNGTRVASHVTERGVGLFETVGLFAEGQTEQYTVYVDGVRAVGAASGSALPPVTSADVDVLLESVPEGFRDSCEETAVSMFEPGAIVAVSCSLGHPDADVVEYVQFDSTESMEAAYQQRVASYASDVTGTTCSEGPSELAYDVGGQEAGRLFCAPQTVGIRLDWTDTRLNILSSVVDYDAGSEGYPGLFEIWLLAGPELPSGEI